MTNKDLSEIIEQIEGMKKPSKFIQTKGATLSWTFDPEMGFYNQAIDRVLSYLHSLQPPEKEKT